MSSSKSLSPTLREELIDRLSKLIKRLNEKNYDKFMTQSQILDRAIATCREIPQEKTEALEGGKKKNKGFSIDEDNYELLEESPLGVSGAVSEILKSEILVYEQIEEMAENAIIGHDNKMYFVLVDALHLLDGCLGVSQFDTVVIRGETLMHATYEDIFTTLLLEYKDCQRRNGAKGAN